MTFPTWWAATASIGSPPSECWEERKYSRQKALVRLNQRWFLKAYGGGAPSCVQESDNQAEVTHLTPNNRNMFSAGWCTRSPTTGDLITSWRSGITTISQIGEVRTTRWAPCEESASTETTKIWTVSYTVILINLKKKQKTNVSFLFAHRWRSETQLLRRLIGNNVSTNLILFDV